MTYLHLHRLLSIWTGFCVKLWWGGDRTNLVLLGQRSQVLQSALDLGRDRWWHGDVVSLGLESVLIGDVADLDRDSLGGGVAELALSDLEIFNRETSSNGLAVCLPF